MNLLDQINSSLTRRHFFRENATGLGYAALASLLSREAFASSASIPPALAQIAPKAKRCIYLSMIGAPSQFETFDYKPKIEYDKDLKEYLEKSGQRLTGMTSGQSRFPTAPSIYQFKQHGSDGTWVSELLPWTAKMADDITVIRSMNTDAINHEPANQLMYTGNMVGGKASLGSWLSYGLGSMNQDLPTFVVLHAQHSNPGSNVQAISSRLWGSAFLPGKHAGVSLRSGVDPVLFLKDSAGIPRELRRKMLDGIAAANHRSYEAVGDPEIQTRIQQYEMAFRMQSSVPELADLSKETEATYELYGPDSKKPGTFAASALMARRMVERGVRFVQIFHRGWDQHGNLPHDIKAQCGDIDQGSYGLIQDLKQRGMLEDTLVIWGGEFGRTVYSQGGLSKTNYGRDHHPRAFSIWMAGGGVKGGFNYGTTDDMSFNILENPVHVRDLHATILQLMGIDHHKLTFKYQGLDNKITGVAPVNIPQQILL